MGSRTPDTAEDAPVTRREIDQRLHAILKMAEVQFAGISSNVNTAYASMEKRLDGMNEIRGSLNDLSSQMLTRVQFEQYKDGNDAQFDQYKTSATIAMNELKDAILRRDGEAKGVRSVWALVGGSAIAAAALVSVIQFLLLHAK